MSDQKDKTKEILEKLENGIKETMDSEKYRAFLHFQSQFHSYSFNNAMLIYLQRPDATRVAGYKSWQKLGRNVMKGEKGISILAPNPYTFKKEVDKIDPKTNKPVINPKTGDVEKVTVEMKGLSFRKVTVFDVKQTEGKELPSICEELQGNSINSKNVINAIKKISEVPIIVDPIVDGSKGYYNRLENLIVLKEGMSLDQTAKTIVHEYAHSQLHNTEAAASLDRATKEVQVESVAYIVSDRFGIDTSEYSFEYLANWSSGKELSELKSSFDLIQKTADKIIQGIEGVLLKELELQNCPAKIVIQWSESDKLQKGQIFDVVEANELFTKLDQEQAELIKKNPDIDFTKVTAGEKIDWIPYLKTKFELHLADGRIMEGRFDFGESGYKDLFECIKRECKIDVQNYIKQFEENKTQGLIIQNVAQKEISVHGKIVDLYKSEFKAIKNISENTAKIIDNLNQQRDTPFTIKEIKQKYKELGKQLEKSNNKTDLNEFKLLENVVDDLKQAQKIEKQALSKEKAIQNKLNKTTELEMVQ